MFRHNAQSSMMARNTLPSPDNTSPSDSETDIVVELEQKRRQLDEEIARFKAQKDKEFRDFENDLRLTRRLKECHSPRRRNGHHSGDASSRPKRTSSSSALDLLVGHGTSKQPQPNRVSPHKNGQKQYKLKDGSATHTVPSASKPTLSLDPMNIKGETFPQSQLHTPPTPTLLSRSLTRSSSTSSISVSPPKERSSSATVKPPAPPTPGQERSNSFTGLFLPSYLPLLDAQPNSQYPSTSALVTPPIENGIGMTIIQPVGSITLPHGIIPLQSSSFPPHITMLSPTNPASKRSYTAPTISANRMPSALRTASGDNIGRKRKRVTFRLADSAIVEPSSSYEEGSSPQSEGSTSSTTKKGHSKGNQSPLRHTNPNAENSLLGSKKTSDEEDAEAGVLPGMSMGEVMQKLNNYQMASSDEDEVNADFDDDEDVAYMETKYHEDDEEEAVPMGNLDTGADAKIDEPDADGYFSPLAKHAVGLSFQHSPERQQVLREEHQRSNSSPLSPYRDENWDKLSSSDKDRLLFARQGSDEDDSDQGGKRKHLHPCTAAVDRVPIDHSQLARSKDTLSSSKHDLQVSHAVDGGSGVGFFELDEELASPDAGVARPFEVSNSTESIEAQSIKDFEDNNDDDDDNDEDNDDEDEDTIRLNTHSKTERINDSSQFDPTEKRDFGYMGEKMQDLKASERSYNYSYGRNEHRLNHSGNGGAMGSSVPIDIVRPSASVSSSWVGTFGH